MPNLRYHSSCAEHKAGPFLPFPIDTATEYKPEHVRYVQYTPAERDAFSLSFARAQNETLQAIEQTIESPLGALFVWEMLLYLGKDKGVGKDQLYIIISHPAVCNLLLGNTKYAVLLFGLLKEPHKLAFMRDRLYTNNTHFSTINPENAPLHRAAFHAMNKADRLAQEWVLQSPTHIEDVTIGQFMVQINIARIIDEDIPDWLAQLYKRYRSCGVRAIPELEPR